MGESVDTKACRLCLDMDCNLLSIDIQLENTMKSILGQNISYDSGLPKYACEECANFLGKFKTFRDKCLEAQTVLYNVLKNASKITDSEIKKLNRTKLKLELPLPPSLPSAKAEAVEPCRVNIPCVTVKLEPVDVPMETDEHFEEDDDDFDDNVSFDASNEPESKTEKKRHKRPKKHIKKEIKLELKELDISEGFTVSVPTIENVDTKTEPPDDEELSYHCHECCQGYNEDSDHKCPADDPSHTIQSDKNTGNVENNPYLQFREKENARKKRFLDKMTPEQKALKKKKDLEWYHRRKVKKTNVLSEEQKAKKRESWKKSSQRYRQRKKERKIKGQVDSSEHKQ